MLILGVLYSIPLIDYSYAKVTLTLKLFFFLIKTVFMDGMARPSTSFFQNVLAAPGPSIVYFYFIMIYCSVFTKKKPIVV